MPGANGDALGSSRGSLLSESRRRAEKKDDQKHQAVESDHACLQRTATAYQRRVKKGKSAVRRGLSAQLPDGVEYRAVDPLHYRHRTISSLWLSRLSAADAFDFGLDVLNGSDGQTRAFHRVEQILA